MQIHQLRLKTPNRKKKRIARGGKRGTTSGRGQKGQKSRAGRKIRPAERDIILKLPKFRGQKNPTLRKKETKVINLVELEEKVSGGIINKKVLLEVGLMDGFGQKIKILGKGTVKKSFQIEGIELSKSAKEKIEKVGGKIK